MKYFRYIINVFIILIIVSLLVFKSKNNSINYKNESLGIDFINKKEVITDNNNSNIEEDVKEEEINEEKVELSVVDVPVVEEKKEEIVPVQKEEVVVEPAPVQTPTQTPVEEPVSNNVETIVGALSAYGPDCVGCSGYLASGFNALNGNIYYNDSTYGTVRIVAGDRSYPFGSIINIKGTWLGEVKAIVLDRGGGVGIGKRFLFDLLFNSEAEASSFGSYRNVTFEILRYGY